MSNAFQTIAYHKNSASTAAWNIMVHRFFISHDKPDNEMWLGDGIYFWEKQRDAEWWDGGYENETIVKATLTCNYDDFANLDEEDALEEFKLFCQKTKDSMENQNGMSFDFSNGRFQVNSFFFNVFKETYNILLIKYSFPRRNNRPQYCATNNDIVSDIQIAARLIANRWEWC